MAAESLIEARRILVSGVGGAPTFDLARELLKAGHQVIAIDCDPLAPGLKIPGVTAQVTASADDPSYPRELIALCERLRPEAIFCGVEQELPPLLRLRPNLDALKVRAWLPPALAVAACLDKAHFARLLRENGIPAPRTWLPHRLHEIRGIDALVVKPRRGQGAKNVHICTTRAQARALCELVPDPLIQERIEGREFTADCLTGPDGQCSVILRWRLLVKGGLAMVSETFQHEGCQKAVRATLAALGMSGVCCVQGFVRNSDGAVLITEANARFAGAFLASVAAGADLVGQALRGTFGLDIDHAQLRYRPGVRTTKYVETLDTAGPATIHEEH
ncbi:MAG: ATP-grasp domain-containing protein [Sciscionella sp.]